MIPEVVIVDDADPDSGDGKDVHWLYMRSTDRRMREDPECITVEPVPDSSAV
jgi:hypothetical protein